MIPCRWEPCVQHLDEEANRFMDSYFASPDRQVLVIGAAGFDPMSTVIASRVASAAGDRVRGFFIREERPEAGTQLVARGDATARELRSIIAGAQIESINVFDPDDQAVVGGRRAVNAVSNLAYSGVTDVVVDISVLTIGVSFPIVKWLLERARALGNQLNVHAIAAYRQDSVVPDLEFADSATFIHGFDGSLGLYSEQEIAWLWIPQLTLGKGAAFDGIYQFLQSRAGQELHEVCPLLPFPCWNPRAPDEIIAFHQERINGDWSVDERSVLYAAANDPGDVYRILLRLDQERRDVFEGALGGSALVLSPVGCRATALGCLMAAVEANMPVVYQETVRYDPASSESAPSRPCVAHVWLAGEAYPR